MDISAAEDRGLGRGSAGRATLLATASAAATAIVFIPILARSPSTTEAVPALWLVALLAAAPLTAYLLSRRLKTGLGIAASLAVGLPQVPVIVLLSAAGIWLDVQRGALLAGSGEEAMSYGIGTIIAAAAGILLLVLVAAAAWLGGRRRR